MTAPKEWAVFLEKAVQSYQTFASSPPPMDAKEFNAYHGACKSALMHIALLEKLIELNPEKPPDSDRDLRIPGHGAGHAHRHAENVQGEDPPVHRIRLH